MIIDEHEERIAAMELRQIIFHEAGHNVVYSHFGINSKVEIWRPEKRNEGEKAWRGYTDYMSHNLTPYQKSVAGWAGLLCDDLALPNATKKSISAVKLCLRVKFDRVSETDNKNIHSHPDIWKTCDEAQRILRQNYGKLQAIFQACLNQLPNANNAITYGDKLNSMDSILSTAPPDVKDKVTKMLRAFH